MSRNIRKRRTIIMIIAALAVMFATGVYAAVPKGVTHIDLITDSGETVKEALEVYVGTETKLSCKTVPVSFMNRDIEYSIADDTIAEVDKEGLLKALKDGETRLTVECAGVRKNYTVKVETAVEDITGLEEEITLYEGDEFQLEPKIKMADKNLEKPAIKYAAKRNTIADVDKNGLVTGIKEGETTITVSAGDLTKKVKVTVEARPVGAAAPVVTYNNNNSNNNGGGTRSSGYSRSNSGRRSSNGGSGGGSSSSSSGSGSSSGSSGNGSTDNGSGDGPTDSGSGDGPTDSGSGDGPTDSGSSGESTDSGSGGGPSDSGSTEVSTGE